MNLNRDLRVEECVMSDGVRDAEYGDRALKQAMSYVEDFWRNFGRPCPLKFLSQRISRYTTKLGTTPREFLQSYDAFVVEMRENGGYVVSLRRLVSPVETTLVASLRSGPGPQDVHALYRLALLQFGCPVEETRKVIQFCSELEQDSAGLVHLVDGGYKLDSLL